MTTIANKVPQINVEENSPGAILTNWLKTRHGKATLYVNWLRPTERLAGKNPE